MVNNTGKNKFSLYSSFLQIIRWLLSIWMILSREGFKDHSEYRSGGTVKYKESESRDIT